MGAKVIAFANNKGGVLKTTSATNVAGILAKAGKRVLLVDMDAQGNCLISFAGHNPDNLDLTIYDVLIHGADPKEVIVNVYPNLDILPSNDEMSFFDQDIFMNLDMYPDPYKLLQRRIKELEQLYDFIILDTPPNIGIATGLSLAYAHEVIVPFVPESYAMRSLNKMMKAARLIREKHNPRLKVRGILATMVQETLVHSDVLSKVPEFCESVGTRLFQARIPRTIKFANSVHFNGMPASLWEGRKDKDETRVVGRYIDFMQEAGYIPGEEAAK